MPKGRAGRAPPRAHFSLLVPCLSIACPPPSPPRHPPTPPSARSPPPCPTLSTCASPCALRERRGEGTREGGRGEARLLRSRSRAGPRRFFSNEGQLWGPPRPTPAPPPPCPAPSRPPPTRPVGPDACPNSLLHHPARCQFHRRAPPVAACAHVRGRDRRARLRSRSPGRRVRPGHRLVLHRRRPDRSPRHLPGRQQVRGWEGGRERGRGAAQNNTCERAARFFFLLRLSHFVLLVFFLVGPWPPMPARSSAPGGARPPPRPSARYCPGIDIGGGGKGGPYMGGPGPKGERACEKKKKPTPDRPRPHPAPPLPGTSPPSGPPSPP